MSVAKTIEITAESRESFGDAIREGIRKASNSIDNIKNAWIKDQIVTVDAGNVTGYRVRLKVTFELE